MRARILKFFKVLSVATLSGCATAGPSTPTPPPAAAPVSFDGTYRGRIQLTSTSSEISGAGSHWCDTPPVLSLLVQHDAFNYILAHPNVPQDSAYSLSPTFAVTLAPNGSFGASSQNGEAEMVGRITELHMAGQINGTACGYAFTADRM